MLDWIEKYATGSGKVDDQHKKLFNMVNDFEELVRNKTAKDRFCEALRFLGDYVTIHFKTEEAIMDEFACPAADDNKKAHAEFRQVFEGFLNRAETEGYSDKLAKDLLRTLQKWLIQHICGVDIRLRRYCPSHA